MRNKLRPFVQQHWQRATPASVFTGAAALCLTMLCFWLYLQLFLLVHDIFPDPSPFEFSLDHWLVRIRVAFELLALCVLWRYWTPKKVYRYWQVRIYELASPFLQSWKGMAATLATIVCGLTFSFGAAIAFTRIYDDPPASTSSRLDKTPYERILPDQAATD